MSSVAPDGSPVEVYRRLPLLGEDELVRRVAAPPRSVLDLGCGVGRIANVLAAAGYDVTGVDNSAAMLTHLDGVEPVHADIETLDLGRTYDVVLLASHFVNDASHEGRRRVLDVCARHVETEGVVVIQAYPPDLEWRTGSESRIAGVVVRVVSASRDDDIVDATIEYEIDGERWAQAFRAQMLDEPALAAELRTARLEFGEWLDRSRGWLTARPAR